MKIRLTVIAVLAALAAALCLTAAAADTGGTDGNIRWVLTDEGALTLSGTGAMKDYSGDDSPWGTDIKSLVINNGITGIGMYAFYGCENLESVSLPTSLREIGHCAFFDCQSLTSISIPEGVTYISTYAFSNCFHLVSVTLPETLQSLDYRSFRGCGNLAGITIPGKVTTVSEEAFADCYNMTSVTISEGVTTLEWGAFAACSLTSVKLPKSLETICDHAFFEGCMTSIVIPASVKNLEDAAFMDSNKLENVYILNPETVFGDDPFCYCPSGMTIWGYSGSTAQAYAETKNYPFVIITEMGEPDYILPENLREIGAEAFSNIKAGVVYIPDGVTSLDSKAFANSASLRQVRFPETVIFIPSDIFDGIPKDQLTIFAAPGSAAESFAIEEGIRFMPE